VTPVVYAHRLEESAGKKGTVKNDNLRARNNNLVAVVCAPPSRVHAYACIEETSNPDETP
jgi:hypothetical protein